MVKILWTALYFKNQPENTDLKIALRLALEEMTNLSKYIIVMSHLYYSLLT